MKYIITVQMNLEIEADTAQEAYVISQNMELPKYYQEWSWDTRRVRDENWEDRIVDLTNWEEEDNKRICDECWKETKEWYCINWWEEYYCSDECLHKHITPEEREELYDDWNWDSYWTEREEDDVSEDDMRVKKYQDKLDILPQDM